MHEKWNASTSKEYKIKQLLIAVVFWVLFNVITGVLTGDHALDDNYFILFVCLFVAGNRNSYKVFYNSGFIVTRQFGMVTQNISLYKASEVFEKSGNLYIHYPDDSRYKIKIHAFDAPVKLEAKETIVPIEGEPPPRTEKNDPKAMKPPKKPNYVQSIFGGVVLLALGIVSLETGVVYLPSKGGFIHLANEPTAFYVFQGFCFVVGVFSLVYGAIGLARKKNA